MSPLGTSVTGGRTLASTSLAAAVLLLFFEACGSAAPGVGASAPTASQYIISTRGMDDGLPSDKIKALVQTRDGYLWVATFNGLARFDGVRFRLFDSGNTPALRNNLIRCLFEDREGRLWIGSDTGEISWRDEIGFHALANDRHGSSAPVDRITQAGDGTVWVLNRDGDLLPIRNVSPGQSVRSPSARPYDDLISDAEGQLWVRKLGASAIVRFDAGVEVAPDADSPAVLGWRTIAPARHGGIWVRDGEQLRRRQHGEWIEDRGVHPWGRAQKVTLLETAKGEVWVGTLGGGLHIVSPEGRGEHLDSASGLSHNSVVGLTEDREGNVWVGTSGGLDLVRPRSVTMVGLPDPGRSRTVRSVTLAAGGGLWVGTEGAGVYRWEAGQFSGGWRTNQSVARSLALAVRELRDGALWVGTDGGGVVQLRDRNYEVPKTDFPMPGVVHALFESAAGDLWVGAQNGVLRKSNNKWDWLGQELYRPDVRCLAELRDGSIWLGLRGGGLVRWQAGRFTQYRQADGLPSEFVSALCADAEAALWIGSAGGGLARLKAGRFARFTMREGLPSDFITHIEDDGHGGLWVGSNAGIFRVAKAELERSARGEPGTLKCLVLDGSDGLASLTMGDGNQPAGCRTPDGRFWFATSRGLAVVDPAKVRSNPVPPPVCLEAVMVDGQVQEQFPSPEPQGLTVAAGAGQIEFHYTAMSLSSPKRVRFKYRLAGLDDGWVDAGGRRTAYYSHVPPGDYEFQVIACNNHGVWNETGAGVRLQVLPQFWQTWWFAPACWIAGLTAVGGGVWLVARRHHQQRVVALQRAGAVERERSRIAQDLHDDLGTGLTEIDSTSALGREFVLPPEETQGYFREIGDRARQMVMALDEIVWAVNPKNDTLNSLASYFCQFTQQFLKPTPLRCWFHVAEHLPALPLDAEQRHGLLLAFKEALHNALRHSRATELHLTIAVEENALQIIVADNGCGFVEQPPPAGADGLTNMRHRLEQLGGRCEISSASGGGTRVVFVLPHLSSGRP